MVVMPALYIHHYQTPDGLVTEKYQCISQYQMLHTSLSNFTFVTTQHYISSSYFVSPT
jgi:predicted NAD-dependent protein-ADP-ribosyltransferase YbiA (DUF1768 family)